MKRISRPPSGTYRVGKFIRRHRTWVTAAAAIVVSLVAGLIAAGVSLRREKAARERAVTAEHVARIAAEKSRQVAQFMKDMLGSVGPSVARGRDTTLLREVLEDTIQRLDTDLRNHPDVASNLRHTLGVAFKQIGEYDRAIRLWREAITARHAFGDRTSVELGATLHELGSMLARTNQAADAEAKLQEALAIRRSNLGPEHFVGSRWPHWRASPAPRGSRRNGRCFCGKRWRFSENIPAKMTTLSHRLS